MDYSDGIKEWSNSLNEFLDDNREWHIPAMHPNARPKTIFEHVSIAAYIRSRDATAFLFDDKHRFITLGKRSLSEKFKAASIDFGQKLMREPLQKWELRVWRSELQSQYNDLEVALEDVIKHCGEDKAIELIPDSFINNSTSFDNFRDNLKALQFETTLLSAETVDSLLEKAGAENSSYRYEQTELSTLGSISNAAFMYTCYAAVFVGAVRPQRDETKKNPNSLSSRFKYAAFEAPFHKWRLSTFRNHYQPHFDKLDTALKTVIDTYGEDKAIELLPSRITGSFGYGANFRDNMKELQFKTTLLSSNTVDNLLQKAQMKLMQNQQKLENNS